MAASGSSDNPASPWPSRPRFSNDDLRNWHAALRAYLRSEYRAKHNLEKSVRRRALAKRHTESMSCECPWKCVLFLTLIGVD